MYHTILGGSDTLAERLEEDKNTLVVLGDSKVIRHELEEWLKQFDSVQFVSDVCHYDFVLLIDIFGTALDLPVNVSAVCYAIRTLQDTVAFLIERPLTKAERELFLNFADSRLKEKSTIPFMMQRLLRLFIQKSVVDEYNQIIQKEAEHPKILYNNSIYSTLTLYKGRTN